jgi:hypothetical protein
MIRLRPSKAPNLLNTPQVYSAQHFDQLLRELRVYFNTIDNGTSNAFGVFGGQYIDFPNGLFFNTVDQTFANPNQAYPVVYNETYLNSGVELKNNSEAHVSVGGIYNFQYSGQLSSSSGSTKTAYIWIRRSNTDIGFSTHAYTITGSGTDVEISWSFNIDMQAGDYLEIIAAVTDTGAFLDARAAASPHPGIPSSVLAVNYMGPLPDVLPTPP